MYVFTEPNTQKTLWQILRGNRFLMKFIMKSNMLTTVSEILSGNRIFMTYNVKTEMH